MVGKVISHYQILEKLGEGGMGVVYKVEDTKPDRMVALKFLLNHLLCDEETETRFTHEPESASSLNHTNVTTIYEIYAFSDLMCISNGTPEHKVKEVCAKLSLKYEIRTDGVEQDAEGDESKAHC